MKKKFIETVKIIAGIVFGIVTTMALFTVIMVVDDVFGTSSAEVEAELCARGYHLEAASENGRYESDFFGFHEVADIVITNKGDGTRHIDVDESGLYLKHSFDMNDEGEISNPDIRFEVSQNWKDWLFS